MYAALCRWCCGSFSLKAQKQAGLKHPKQQAGDDELAEDLVKGHELHLGCTLFNSSVGWHVDGYPVQVSRWIQTGVCEIKVAPVVNATDTQAWHASTFLVKFEVKPAVT